MKKIKLNYAISVLSLSLLFCSQNALASEQNIEAELELTVITPMKKPCPKYGLASCLVTMTSDFPEGTLQVANRSNRRVTNIRAYLPSSLSDITQDADDCRIVEAHQTCTLIFTASATLHAPTPVTVRGDRTTTLVFDMEVLA
jgi:hypothetical protein